MRIALVLVCCLVSSTLWEATAHAMEPQPQQTNRGLSEKGRKILRDIQVSDEVNGSEPRSRNSTLARGDGPGPGNGGNRKSPLPRPTSSPTPIQTTTTPSPTPPPQSSPTPIPKPTSTVPAQTPAPETKPIPEPRQTPNRNLAFLVSLILLILVGLVMLVIMGKKIYGLARGG